MHADFRSASRVSPCMSPGSWTALAFALLLSSCGGGGSRGRERPNLLLVTIDTVRADRLGCYGYADANTPHLDALAERGVVFEEAYSPAPMTLPAHSTLMTGLLPPQHGARVNGMHKLAEDVPTLPEILGEAGYRTGAFIAAYVLDGKFGLERGFDRYDDDLTLAYEQEVQEGLSTYRPGNVVVDAALEWLREEDDRPFFAWVHLYDAHFPWHPHGPDVEDPNAETGTYDGEVTFVDEQVGRLLDYLRGEDLEERTLVVAVADHGEGLGDHHEIEHAYLLNEEVLHVPWIMAGPQVSRGHRVDALVSLEDFQPTVLELLDLADAGAYGRSLAAALAGEDIPSGTSYAETDLPWTGFRWAPQRSLTTVEWKYIRTPQAELYDRERDREEYANLAETRRDVREELEQRLTALEEEVGQRASDVASLSAEELEQLEALGYAAGSADEIPEDTSELADMKQRFAVKDLATELRRRKERENISPEEEIRMAQQLVEASPETPAFHSHLGEALTKVGDYEHAIAAFSNAVDLAPTDAGLHYSLGDALQQFGRTAEARPHIEMALELAPEMASAHVAMGNILRSEGRTDLAAGEYSEALRLRPEYPEALYNLAQSFRDRGLLAKAIENLEEALEYRPEWGLAHATLAGLLLEFGRPEDAVGHFAAAVEQSPGDPNLHNDFGTLLAQLDKPNEARDHFAAAIQLAPGFLRPRLNLANLAFDYGNDENALRHYEEAHEMAPEELEPAARLARFLATTPDAALRDGERAIQLAEQAANQTGGRHARVLDTLAAAYACVGRFDEASTVAQRAHALAAQDGDGALAQAIEGRLALYGRSEAYVVPRE